MTYTINTDSEIKNKMTVSKILINSDQKIIDYLNTYKIILPKIEKTIFGIEDLSLNIISARNLISSSHPAKLRDITVEYVIDLDLKSGKVYSYIVKNFAEEKDSDYLAPEIRMMEAKAKFLTSIMLNLSRDSTNNPNEISRNLSIWEKHFENVWEDYYSTKSLTSTYTEQCIRR